MIRLALGVIACGSLAAGLAWSDISQDMATATAREQTKADRIAAYRSRGAILHCHAADNGDTPAVAPSTFVVPPPEGRGGGFDMAAVDRIVATQYCDIDTSMQDVWAATHRPAAPAASYMPAAYMPVPPQSVHATTSRRPGGFTHIMHVNGRVG